MNKRENIPADLVALNQWIVWRLEDGAKKMPYSVSGRAAKSNDPDTWSTFSAATAKYVGSLANGRPYSGIGFVFSAGDDFCGIDLDGCRNVETGEIAEWAQEIISQCVTYSEVSPSGTGVKLFARGKVPSKSGKKVVLPDAPRICDKQPAIEVYDKLRYFAVTGDILPGSPNECRDCQPVIDAMWARFAKPVQAAKPKIEPTYSANGRPDNRIERARKYVDRMPAAVSGSGGSDATFAVACEIFRFGLDEGDAWNLLCDYNARCSPPWEERDLRHKLDSARETVLNSGEFGNRLQDERQPASGKVCKLDLQTSATQSPLLLPQNLTDDENGRRFAREHGNVVRYCATWGKWLAWDGRRWAVDEMLAVQNLAKQTNDGVWSEVLRLVSDHNAPAKQSANLLGWGKYVGSVRGTEAMLTKAASEPGIVITHAQLDRCPWLLNVQNGTIDLRTGKLRPHDRGDSITKVAPVAFDADAECPKWRKFVSEIMGGNQALIGYLRSLAGYWLTGVVRDHILPMFIGKGANGKSVFLNTIQTLLGPDYCIKAAPDLLLAKKHNTHPTELADLFGKRLVCAIEIESGRRLAESLIKELTGGDKVRARRMREDFWEFDPSHKVVIAANHRPIVRGQDHGIWRRLRIVPFEVVIPAEKQNKRLPEELRAELPGILNWALLGCSAWQTDGLGEPVEVMAATRDYQAESDQLADFIAERCVVNDRISVPAGQLYEAYKGWCETNGHTAENSTAFGRLLNDRGFDVRKTKTGNLRMGIGVRASQ